MFVYKRVFKVFINIHHGLLLVYKRLYNYFFKWNTWELRTRVRDSELPAILNRFAKFFCMPGELRGEEKQQNQVQKACPKRGDINDKCVTTMLNTFDTCVIWTQATLWSGQVAFASSNQSYLLAPGGRVGFNMFQPFAHQQILYQLRLQ